MSKIKIDLNEAFSGAMIAQEIPELEEQVKNLKLELSKKNGELDIPIEQIHPNPNQPRKSFYVVERMSMSLKEAGQTSPIELVKCTNGNYLIFDGECRWRAAKNLKWKTIRAVIKPYHSESFDDEVLTSSIVRNNLNSLDLAEALIQKIAIESIKFTTNIKEQLDSGKISTLLNTAVVRLKRKKQQKEIKKLINKSKQERINGLNQLTLNELEINCFQIIMSYGINPISFNQNQLPMLKLPGDLKEAIRNFGLGDSHARTIARLNANKLNITEEKAITIRQELIQAVLTENLSIVMTGSQVDKIIQNLNQSSPPQFSQNVQKCIQIVDKLDLTQLTSLEKKALISRFQAALKEIKKL